MAWPERPATLWPCFAVRKKWVRLGRRWPSLSNHCCRRRSQQLAYQPRVRRSSYLHQPARRMNSAGTSAAAQAIAVAQECIRTCQSESAKLQRAHAQLQTDMHKHEDAIQMLQAQVRGCIALQRGSAGSAFQQQPRASAPRVSCLRFRRCRPTCAPFT